MYTDNVKAFAKKRREQKTLMQTIRIYSQIKTMRFGIEKCAVLIMKRGKRRTVERIELPNQKRI